MPWQELVVNVGLETLADGRPAYHEVIVTVPRQQGKTTLDLAVECHRGLLWQPQPQRILYSAQTGWDGHKKLLEDQVPIMQASRIWEAVARVYRAAGNDGVVFQTTSRIDVMASGLSAGHGRTVDLGIIDEAFDDEDDRREQAMRPAMMTRPAAQLWITSTAGHEGSVYLRRKVDAGRAAAVEDAGYGVAYFEWSADPDAPIDDPETWRSCMPALGITVSEEVIRTHLQTMRDTPNEFARAYLNRWTVARERLIPLQLWQAVCDTTTAPGAGLVLGVDAAADRTAACIVAADAQRRAEVVEYGEGVSWLEDRVVELATKHSCEVAIDDHGPAAWLIPALETRGVRVEKFGTTEMVRACSQLYDGIADAKVSVRATSGDVLDLAVAGVTKRPVGEAWMWGRKTSLVDVSPLLAWTCADALAVTRGRTTEPWFFYR